MKQFVCVCCGSKSAKIFLQNGQDFEYEVKGKFRLVKCCNCGLVSLWPMLTVQQLLNAYPDSYHSYNLPISRITRFLGHLVRQQEARKFRQLIGKKGKILDVGCADGRQFDDWHEFGDWQFVGIDFNDQIAKRGVKTGREIYSTTLEKFSYPKKTFDLIIMDHLLEHVVDPIETLKAAYLLLKKGGYLIGAVPNINCLDRILWGRFWGGYHLPRHVWHFDHQTLSQVFKKTGFRLRYLEYNLHTGHWALSIQNFFQSKKLTKTRIKQGRTFYYPMLLVLLIPVNLIQKLFRRTGVISFVARKD